MFINSIQAGSRASEAGLKRGDQIMEMNGQSFEDIPLSKATEILKCNTHLDVTVKTNLLVFKELLIRLAEEKDGAVPNVDIKKEMNHDKVNKTKANTASKSNRLRKLLEKTRISILPRKLYSDHEKQQSPGDGTVGIKQRKPITASFPASGTLSSRKPHLLKSHHCIQDFNNLPSLPDQVLKVFNADRQSRYVLVSRQTTAKEVVGQALRAFNLKGSAEADSLCMVSVTSQGTIKQRQLPDQLSKLADKIQLSGGYYLKNNTKPEMLCSDEDARDPLSESCTSLRKFSATDVAAELTRRIFGLFRNIKPTENRNGL